MVKAGPSRTRERGDRRKSAILAAAMRLYGERGYQSTSLDDIATAVGITRAGLLHHFRSKQDLLWAVLDERDRAGDNLAMPIVGGGLALLDGYVDVMRMNQRERGLAQLYILLLGESVPDDHPGHDHFATRYRLIGRRVIQLLRADQAAGLIRSDVDLEALEPITSAGMDGLLLRYLYDPKGVDLAASFRIFADALKMYLQIPTDEGVQTDTLVSQRA